MTKELRELLQQLDTLKTEVRSLMGEDKVKEAEEKMKDVRALQSKIKIQQELEADEKRNLEGNPVDKPKEERDLEKEYRNVFLKAVRRQRITADDISVIGEYRAMHSGAVVAEPDGDTSLIIPEDISTNINELKRAFNDLSVYFTNQTVTAASGSRVLEKDEDMTPFAVVDEYGEIQEIDNPKFSNLTWKLVKRAGYLPLTNELLKDTDQNIIAYVTKWIAKKHVVTTNTQIIALLNTLTKQGLTDIKAINKVLNVTLDPALSLSSIILTNQDGFNWLDEQVDGNGRFLLQDDITQPGKKLFKGKRVVPIANRVLPTSGTTTKKAPFIIGDLKELAVLWTDGKYELASTKEGGDAWRRDTTELRTIVRNDLTLWDDKAAVFGEITLS